MNDYSATKDLVEATGGNQSTLMIALIVMISLNIGVEIFRYIGMLNLSNKDKSNKRQLLIEEKRIKVLENVYRSLDSISLLSKGEEQKMLEKTNKISLYVTQNKLYIPKPLQFHINYILDYFRIVMTDFRQKSIEKETALFEGFCDEFNK